MNSYLAISCLLATAAVASANPIGLIPIATIDHISHPSYGFNYAVNDPHTGDNKAQWETRDGDVVRGAYSLVEPDGNVRLVEYTADDLHGFNAVVKRTGPNLHSVALPAPHPIAPIVTKPIAASYSYDPIGPIGPIAPIAAPYHSYDPIDPIGPIVPIAAPYHSYGPIAPLAHTQVITPIIDAPIIAPVPVDVTPYWSVPPPSPWVSLSGSTYGHKGNIVRRWAAGPISLDGKKLTIKTKHY